MFYGFAWIIVIFTRYTNSDMERPIYIDTHAHLYDEAFKGDALDVVRRARDKGIRLILQPDIDSSERTSMIETASRFPHIIRNMAGLYPGSVQKDWEEEIDAVRRYAEEGNVVAIGEIGLDYHYGKETAELQQVALAAQFDLAAKLGLPVNIHERDATEDFFKILSEHRHLGLRGNMHAFSGSYETFLRLQKYGDWSVGIGGVITFKKASIAETVKKIPLEKILLETDAPYLTPVPYRGSRNESSYIPLIAEKIAVQKGISTEEVAEVTTANACTLFNLKLPET